MTRAHAALLLIVALVGLPRLGAAAPADPFEALDLVRPPPRGARGIAVTGPARPGKFSSDRED